MKLNTFLSNQQHDQVVGVVICVCFWRHLSILNNFKIDDVWFVQGIFYDLRELNPSIIYCNLLPPYLLEILELTGCIKFFEKLICQRAWDQRYLAVIMEHK